MSETERVDEGRASDEGVPDGEGVPEEPAEDNVVDLAWPIPLWTMVPLAVALVATMAWAFGTDRVLVSILPFMALIAAVTVIDLRELRIPNRLLQPAALLALVLIPIASTSDWHDLSLVRALLGALVYGAIYFIVLFIYPPGMGWGDVKFAPLIGAQLGLFGWIPLVRALIASHLVAGAVAIIIVIVRLVMRLVRREPRAGVPVAFPFGPFMALGAVVALLLEAASA